MKIAMPNVHGRIHKSLSGCDQIAVFEVEDEQVKHSELIDCSMRPKTEDEMLDVLLENKVDVLICQSVTIGTRLNLVKLKIELVTGVLGAVNETIVRYLSGERIGDEL